MIRQRYGVNCFAVFRFNKPRRIHFCVQCFQAGLVGALPHLLMTIIVPFGGMLADHLRKTGTMTTTNVRKLFNCGGFGMEGFFFLIVALSNSAVRKIAIIVEILLTRC